MDMWYSAIIPVCGSFLVGKGKRNASVDGLTDCVENFNFFQRWVSEKFIVEGLREFELFGGKFSSCLPTLLGMFYFSCNTWSFGSKDVSYH